MNPGDANPRQPPRIMMIDDERSNLQIVKLILARESVFGNLMVFESGLQALEYLGTNRVDLILLDLAMPEMDGFEVMTRLQSNPATSDIPVIFLSAYQDTEYILRAFELGATDFISKPIISPILTARIRHLLESRQLQSDLRDSNEELVNINRLKDELLSICSHDLRAPLSAIELICQFLTDAVAGHSEQSPPELITRIVAQSRLARRLVENLLDLNRIEEGRLLPTPSFFSAAELVHACVGDELPALQARGLRHELQEPAADVLCFGDREMLAQVVHNLLNNASKYARSTIRVSAQIEALDPAQGGWLVLTVADDGRGISAELQSSVFDKYAKLESQGSGSGLGLYISRQVVDLHHGEITLRSAPGEGTVFTVRLPNVFKVEQLPDLAALHRQPVLIASASKPTGQMLESVLVEAGMIAVGQVADAKQLEQALAAGTPALIVVDCQTNTLREPLLEGLNAAAAPPRWIFYGGEPDWAEDLPGAEACIRIAPPLNPLLYLTAVQRQLEPSDPPRAAAEG